MKLQKFKSGDVVVWKGNSKIEFLTIVQFTGGGSITQGEGPSKSIDYMENRYLCKYTNDGVDKEIDLPECILEFK